MCIDPSSSASSIPSIPSTSSEPFATGIAFMDESHQRLHKKLDRLATASDAEFAAGFEALIRQVHDHFKEEEQAMKEIAFPGISCHRDQHAQALNALEHACLRVKEGALAEGREIAALFARWLGFHIATMDSMLASMMQHAGNPESACAPA